MYGLVVGILRENFWEELGAVRGLWTGPWCVGGDFNAITSRKRAVWAAELLHLCSVLLQLLTI